MCPRSTRETDGIAAKLLRCGIASEALRQNLPLRHWYEVKRISVELAQISTKSSLRFCLNIGPLGGFQNARGLIEPTWVGERLRDLRNRGNRPERFWEVLGPPGDL